MAVYAGKTKLPKGDMFDMLEGSRYLGPARLGAPAIGGGSALGLEALWNKITGGKKEDKSIKKTDNISQSTPMPPEDEDPENKDDKVEKIPSDVREDLVRAVVRKIMEEDLDKGNLQVPKDIEDLIKSGTATTSEQDPIRIFLKNYGPDNLKKIMSMSSEFEKMYSPKEAADAIRTAFPDIEQFFDNAKQVSTGLDLIKKYQGGLVGINELTRGL
tara:strand:+ start:831 stop:1475 length:645 start_codon:yes stop_codon:yes gene_type:complete